jgi:Mg-chelatase subunit ChlD
MPRRLAHGLGIVALVVALAPVAGAQEVVPSEKVTSRVILRAAPTTKSADVGSFRPGQRATLLEAGDAWHHVELADGTRGFVSAAWTVLVPNQWDVDVAARPPAGVAEKHADRFDFAPEATLTATLTEGRDGPSGLGGLLRRIAHFFRSPDDVTIDLSSPNLDEGVRQHYDPRLPVAGLAHTSGSKGRFDVMLVIDVSASTSEFAEADVDGDGRAVDDWKSADSILKAQARAAAAFVDAVRRLPGNRDGRRIRVGVVTFSGDDRHLRDPADRDLDLDETDLRALATRDATLVAPLSADYPAIEAELRALGERAGAGMTDFAAGIVRATEELAGAGASGEPREDAERVIYFLTDGKPRLPYDREKADRAARKAASLAGRHRVRIHAFALGKDAVTGRLNDTVQRIARRTGGVCIELENPADIVPLLRATALSFVDRVKLVNRTTGEESDYVSTGIDGSFYGEIPLVEGENEVDLVAVLYGGDTHTETLKVDFEPVAREQRLAEELEEIREENAALIEKLEARLREKLAAEMAAAREAEAGPGQDKELEVTIGQP